MGRFERGLLCVLAAVGVTAAGATSASAVKTQLNLKTAAGELAAGQALVMSSTHVLWQTSNTRVECSKDELEGALVGNGASKDAASFSSVRFEGGEIEGACRSSNLGPAIVSMSNVPWHLEMSKKGTTKLKAAGKMTVLVTFIGRSGAPKCKFEAKQVATSLPTAGPVTIVWEATPFALSKKGNASLCPSEAAVSATWQLTSNGEEVEAEL